MTIPPTFPKEILDSGLNSASKNSDLSTTPPGLSPREPTPSPLNLSGVFRTVDQTEKSPFVTKTKRLFENLSSSEARYQGGNVTTRLYRSDENSVKDKPSSSSSSVGLGLVRVASSRIISLTSPRVPPIQLSSMASSSTSTVPPDNGEGSSQESSWTGTPRTPRKISPQFPVKHEKDAIEKLISKYNGVPDFDKSKKKRISKFNSDVQNEISNNMMDMNAGQFTPQLVDELMVGVIEKQPINFCNIVNNNFSSVSKEDLVRTQNILYQRIISKLNLLNPLTGWFIDRILKFNHVFLSVIKIKNQRSLWTGELLDKIKIIYRRLVENSTPKESIDSLLAIRDCTIRSLILQSLNTNEEIALVSLERIRVWCMPEKLNDLIRLGIARVFKIHIKTPKLYEKALALQFTQNQTKTIVPLIDNVDLHQVARSYFTETGTMFDEFNINGKLIEKQNERGMVGGWQNCRKNYFKNILEKIYGSLLLESNSEYVDEQTTQFLDKHPIQGVDILTLGSNGGWAICNQMFLDLYPPLFKGNFRTRMQPGITCDFNIENHICYSVITERTYFVFEADSTNPDSFYIDNSKPLFSLRVCWEVNRKSSTKGLVWMTKFSFKSLERLHATDDQCYDILTMLKNFVPIPGLHLMQPSSEILRVALEQT